MALAFGLPGKVKRAATRAWRTPTLQQQPQCSAVAASGVLSFLGMGNAESAGAASKGWRPSDEGAPRVVSASGFDVTPMTKAEKKAATQGLSRESKYVCLSAGTERPFSGTTANGYRHDSKSDGVYVCALGGLPLFDSATKFDSGTGWPSFYAPIDRAHVLEITDSSIPFMSRTEVVDARSGAHLGHVFNDGPRPTGLRYCMNAAAFDFVPRAEYAERYEQGKGSAR